MSKKTLVLGASPKPERYSNKAVKLLKRHKHEVVAVALRESSIDETPIVKPETVSKEDDIHTVTLYIGPKHQPQHYDYLLRLQPQRIVFNPGTENDEFEKKAAAAGIEVVEHCTLVMLNNGIY